MDVQTLIDLFKESIGVEAAEKIVYESIRNANLPTKASYTAQEYNKVCDVLKKRGGSIKMIATLASTAAYRNLYYQKELAKEKKEKEELARLTQILEQRVEERTEELRKAQQGLEIRVQERTRELAKANEALRKAYSTLKETQFQLIQIEKMEVVGRLASGVAHEVKNPLAVILQGVDYLSKKVVTDDKSVSATFEYTRDAIKKAANVVRGLLDFSSLSKLDIEMSNLNAVIEKSLFLVKHQLDKCHIQVSKDFKEDIPEVKIDKNRIEQVFVNLFMNAVHAMPDGGRLMVRTYPQKLTEFKGGAGRRKTDVFKMGERVVVTEIEDTGTGIPEDILDKIFDPFFTTGNGTGLGLSVVKNIIELHNAKISIQNKKDGETTVTLMFSAKGTRLPEGQGST